MAWKIVVSAFLAVIFTLIVNEGYDVYSEYREMESRRRALASEAEAIVAENDGLQKNLDSFSDPSVVIKELKTRFNYKLPEEKMIIVAPKEDR